jgi:tetratricopeptide (TPR) repeat protein
MNKDKNLRGLLFKQNYMPWLKVIAIIWFYWYEILIIWIAFEALFVLFKSRKILSISEFSYNGIDEGTEATSKKIVTGLSTLLAVKLGRLNQLYRQVNEERQISSVAITSNPFPASFESKDIQELSSSTIASEIKLTAGKLTIPTTLVNGLIDAIITRPKLNGALHNPANNGSPILTANLIDGLRNLTWRVDGKDKPLDAKEDAVGSGTETKRTRDDMVNELACRIFTDMTFGEGQMIPWKATFYFTEGVKCYRDSLHGQSDKLTKLHQASDYLKKTLSQDENFPWAHYNLGVVYTEMEQHESAKEAFEKSIEVNPDQWQSCYALALNLFEHENKWDDAIGLSEKALYLKPDCLGKAKVYDLLGLAWRKKDNKEKSVENLTKGVIHSLHGLIIAELSGKGQIPAGSVVSKCLSDLADMYNANDDIKPLLKLAAHYSPYDSYVHSRLVAVNDRNLREALKELHRSSSPANAEYWADAACYIVNDYKDSSMLDATVIEILDEFCDAKPECLCKVIEKIRSLNRDHESLSKPLSHLCAIKKFNCQEAINDNYTSDLSYWVDIKGQLHKLWAMRDTPCLSHIKDESPKEIDDLKNIGKIIKEISNNFKPGEKCNPQLGEIIKKLASGLDSLSSKDFWNEIVKFSNIEAGSKAYDERKILRICEELKYSYMLRDIGDICYLFGINIAAANKKTSAAKKIYNDIFKNILIFSKDEIPHEYERLKEDLRIRWRINYGKVEEGEFERNLQLTAKHPLSALHHMNLGRSYFWLNNYVLARSEWNQALLLNPNDPRPIFNIALTYIKESSTLRIDNDIRKSNYAQAEIKLKEALDLSNDTRRKLKINYWLGALKYSNKEYAQAISYYKIAKSLSEDCGLKDKDALLIKNYLGCAYLNLKRYSHGIDELKSLINMDYGDLNKEVGIDIGKPILKGYIMILARLNLALSILQRDADLDEADRCINVACEKIGLFSANKGESKEGLDAFWLDCRGWYLYKKYTSIISPPNTSEAKVKAAEIRVPRIAGSNATVKSGKITGIYSGQKDCCSSIESKDGMLLLKYFNIQNAELNDLKCEGSAINKLVLKSGLIKQGTFKESLPIEKDSVEKGIVKIKDNHGKYSDLLFGYAKIENTSIKDFIIENAVLDQTELIVNDIVINSGEVKSEKGIDEAIKCLEKSIFISAKPSAYLHLALAYELKINEESNQKARDLWKNKALASCQHCKDLDLNDEYKEEADKLEARLNATNGSNPPANKTAGGDAGGKNPKA